MHRLGNYKTPSHVKDIDSLEELLDNIRFINEIGGHVVAQNLTDQSRYQSNESHKATRFKETKLKIT